MNSNPRSIVVRWQRWGQRWSSRHSYPDPLRDVTLTVSLSAPSGARHMLDAFWDGDDTWVARFMPDEPGEWHWTTAGAPHDPDLHGLSGTFLCAGAEGPTALPDRAEPATPFERHGALRLSSDRHHLVHADGTPFFWLADTAWNGPLRSTAEDWEHYLHIRAAQGFSAVQWVTTQWIAAPDGDVEGRTAYTGRDTIAIDPLFFRRLDDRIDAINRHSMLAAPVLLWAALWARPADANLANPGWALPAGEAALLARYMVARWGAHHVVWILNGDGDYDGEHAEHWRRIGRDVFGERPHAPVTLHPGGWRWPYSDFASEAWLDIAGYQSAHRVDEDSLRWLVAGPPSHEWNVAPIRPAINLEPPYEDHMNMSKGDTRIDAHDVRRALYTSLLVAPTAGVSYGGHGVWGWDDGTRPPIAHDGTGIPQPWREALHLPAAEQLPILSGLFGSLPWWQLRPAPELTAVQPGDEAPSRQIVAARTTTGDLALVYTPEARRLELRLDGLQTPWTAQWLDPVHGERVPAYCEQHDGVWVFHSPAPGDWVLVLDARPAKQP